MFRSFCVAIIISSFVFFISACESGQKIKSFSGSALSDKKPSENINVNDLPQLKTSELVGTANTQLLTGTSASITGILLEKGASTVKELGICWSKVKNPTKSDHHMTNPVTDVFALTITGLSENTVYYVRTYATNSTGTGYGNEISFNSGRKFGTVHAGGYVFYNDGKGGGMVIEKKRY